MGSFYYNQRNSIEHGLKEFRKEFCLGKSFERV